MSNDAALVIDLDGTLVRTDLLYESFFSAATSGLKHYWSVASAFRRGKAPLKAFLAEAATVDYELLPYNVDVLQLARDAKSEGRRVFLATASDRQHADAIGTHLGLFDGVFASNGIENLSGETKARRLVESFGEGGFDYVGNNQVDVAIWSHARRALVVGNSTALLRKVEVSWHSGGKRRSIAATICHLAQGAARASIRQERPGFRSASDGACLRHAFLDQRVVGFRGLFALCFIGLPSERPH